MVFWIASVVGLAIAYLFGFTLAGYVAGKLLKGIDVREHDLIVATPGPYRWSQLMSAQRVVVSIDRRNTLIFDVKKMECWNGLQTTHIFYE